jgi:hypothetical protein
MLFAEIFGVSAQFLVAWTCDIFGLLDVWGASGLLFAWLGVFVKWIFAIGRDEANFVRIIS